MEPSALLAFVLAGCLLNLTPGPDVLCISAQALRGGMRAGTWAALGVTAGCMVHVLAAALGLGAVLSTSAWAFNLLKWLGAAYLMFIGVRMLWASSHAVAAAATRRMVAQPVQAGRSADAADAFRSGFLTNVLNPKVALFFLAFVPQFIPAEAEHPLGLFLALGLLFNLNSLPINLGWAWVAARASQSPAIGRIQRWLDRLAGALFIGFGVRLAWSAAPTSP